MVSRSADGEMQGDTDDTTDLEGTSGPSPAGGLPAGRGLGADAGAQPAPDQAESGGGAGAGAEPGGIPPGDDAQAPLARSLLRPERNWPRELRADCGELEKGAGNDLL